MVPIHRLGTYHFEYPQLEVLNILPIHQLSTHFRFGINVTLHGF